LGQTNDYNIWYLFLR